MANQLVSVPREGIIERFTCSICDKLFRDATTISECLHTFCRKCIYKKLANEELDRCPKCNINLGVAPVEKLRPDHNLQDVRAKIFPFKRRRVNASETMASVSLPARRKERSLSSLVVSTPRVSTQASMTGRRTKSFARKAVALRGSSFSMEQSIKKEETPMEGFPDSSSSRETLSKLAHNKRTTGNLYNNLNSTKHEEDDTGSLTDKVDLWKPLTCLVEAANRTKSIKFHSQGPDEKLETPHAANNGARGTKGKTKKHLNRRLPDDDNGSTSVGLTKSKKSNKMKQKKTSASDELGTSAQDILSSSALKRDRTDPVWFKFVKEQEGDNSLPQMPSAYQRVKDGRATVSSVQKYLLVKLKLPNDTEVELTCRGLPLDPALEMHDVLNLYIPTAQRSEKIKVTVGASGKDFVMVLGYRRKIHPTEVQ